MRDSREGDMNGISQGRVVILARAIMTIIKPWLEMGAMGDRVLASGAGSDSGA